MQTLNLPVTEFRVRKKGEKQEIFDRIRKKFVTLTPEEWVRQHFIQYLTGQLNVPSSLVAVEVPMQVNRLKKRGDIVVYGRNGKPCLIVECKAPEVNVTQAVFDQVAIYNMALLVPYLVVTNGLVHFACRINHSDRSIEFLKELPDYQQMSKP